MRPSISTGISTGRNRSGLLAGLLTLVGSLTLALCASACDGDDQTEPEVVTSPKANVRMKNGQRLQKELARMFAVSELEICQELGQYDCFGIHSVVLGNPDAFGSGLYEPLPSSTSTTPMAIERIALSGCSKRVAFELDNPGSATLLSGLDIAPDGSLVDVQAESVANVIDTLYKRALSRRAKASEIDHLRQLYVDVAASGQSAQPARDWATLGCFAVLTTMESLFY